MALQLQFGRSMCYYFIEGGIDEKGGYFNRRW